MGNDMAVGISEILTISRKCTVVGLLFAVIFFTLMVPGHGDDNVWIITNGTVDDIVTTFTDTDWPDNIIIPGNFTQNVTSVEEDALLWFNISTGNLHNLTRDDIVLAPLTIESGVSTFKVLNVKIDTPGYFEEGPTFTLYAIENENNPYLVSTNVPTDAYEIGVFAEDNNNADNSNSTEIEVDNTPPEVKTTEPADLEIDVDIDTNITATFNESMNSSTLNNSTVKVYIQEKTAGETFEDIVGTWDSTNFQGFIYTERLEISPQLIDGSYRIIGDGNITYSTQRLLKDYQIYANEGIEVQGSGNYSIMGWLGDERIVIENFYDEWVISDLVFEQNSTDTKTLYAGEIWDLGDGYSLKLLDIDVDGNQAWLALYNSSGEILNKVCQNQSAGIFTTDMALADDVTLLVTYLKKVDTNTTHIELKYTWLISQDIILITAGSGP
jgi:S-layer protein (TIGR01567 family)